MQITFAVRQKGKPMDNKGAVNWLINILADIGKAEHSDLWHYEQALTEIKDMLESAQPEKRTGERTETHACYLINIQDAIDAIVNCTNCGDEKTLREYVAMHNLENMWSGGVLEALDAVKDLPSAQPYTAEEIQKMQELESVQVEKAYELGRESAQPEQRWIPCSEKLPEEGVKVLACLKDWKTGEIKTVVSYRIDYNYWHGYGRYNEKCVAWMPLPALPEPYQKVE